MSTYYVDLVSGNDANTGGAGDPFLTLNQAIGMPNAPHDIRVAKTTAPSTVDANTWTWTRGSVTVTVNADVTGSIAVGDYIGKPTATGNGATESFYRVSARSFGAGVTTITLNNHYYGTTGSTTGALKLTVVTTGTASAVAATVNVAGHTISGGWNLTGSPVIDGGTWVKSNNAYNSTNALFNITASVTISYFNCLDNRFLSISGSTDVDVSYCTTIGGGTVNINQTSTTATLDVDHCFIVQTVNYCIVNYSVGTSSLTNSVLISKANGYYFNQISTGKDYTFTNNKYFYCLTSGITIAQVGCSYITTGDEFETSGVCIAASNSSYIKGATCIAGTIGVSSNNSSVVVEDCSFSNMTTAGITSRVVNLRVHNCSFTNCGYGINMSDQYSGEILITKCTFTTPTTYAINRIYGASTYKIVNCTIDAPSAAKALAYPTSTAASGTLPDYIIKNSFGLTDGVYYSCGNLLMDTTVHSSAPSLKFAYNTDMFNNRVTDIKVVSVYTANAIGKTITLWMKAAAGWAGQAVPKLKLDGETIITDTTITSISTDWTQVSYHCHNADVTRAGVLTLEFTFSCNTSAIYFDDVTITNTGS